MVEFDWSGFKARKPLLEKAIIAATEATLDKYGKQIRKEISDRSAASKWSPTWEATGYMMEHEPSMSKMLRAVKSSSVWLIRKDVGTVKNGVIGVGIIDKPHMDAKASSDEGFPYWAMHFAIGRFKRGAGVRYGAGQRESVKGKKFQHSGSAPILIQEEAITYYNPIIRKEIKEKILDAISKT